MPTARPLSAAQHARAELHRRQRERSYALLEAARKARRNYNSAATRTAINEELQHRSHGKISAWDWQLDIAEALHLGIDVEAINRTGSGKTLPFILQHFIPGYEKKVTVIISPLNVLEEDQVRHSTHIVFLLMLINVQASRFRDLGLTAIAVNGKTYNAQVRKVRRFCFDVVGSLPRRYYVGSAAREVSRRCDFSRDVSSQR